VEISVLDVDHSAPSYDAVFGWQIGKSSNGRTVFEFDARVGDVSGPWGIGWKAVTEPGLSIYLRHREQRR